jgi:hypothetical protein
MYRTGESQGRSHASAVYEYGSSLSPSMGDFKERGSTFCLREKVLF